MIHRNARLFSMMTFIGMSLLGAVSASASESPAYKDASLPVDARVNDLLRRMTLEEKVAQLQAIWAARQDLETSDGEFTDAKAKEILGLGVGQIARPSENKAQITTNKTPEQTVAFVNNAQRWLIENTRLGIPAIFHEEALHGHAARDATSFPQAIALASTWNPTLIEQMYTVSAAEVRRRGGQQALTPILDVARDPRWGRIEETMGEDPYLIAEMGVAAVRGFQGEGDDVGKDRVIATLKHLAGHGEPTGGMNIAPTPVGERTLREVFLFPFEAAVKLAGARSVMASYNEIDGVPSHANGKLLNDILRGEWGFDGVLVSDYYAISELMTRHHIVATKAEAAVAALQAGVDMELPDGDTYPALVDLVAQGKVDESLIDTAVARVLHEKFMLGLFENPYTDDAGVDGFIGNDEHKALAQTVAEQAIVLLKNDENLLPIDAATLKSVALIGPHADEGMLGGYSDVPRHTVSILEGVQTYLAGKADVTFARGTRLTIDKGEAGVDSVAANTRSKERWNTDDIVLATADDKKGLMNEAVKLAAASDLALIVVGGNEQTSREGWAEGHLGDRTDIQLLGDQRELVEKVLATGTPTVVLLQNGRPLAIPELAEKAPAIMELWYLGQEAGHAVARTVFGDVNPSGKLPVTIARSVGQLPVYYNHKNTAKRGYAFSDMSPLYAFGHGLSYTEFKYGELTVSGSPVKAGGSVTLSTTITNTGKRTGTEVVQLYLHDKVASLTRPVQELKGFARVELQPGQSRTVSFDVAANQLGFYDQDLNYILEPGVFEVMVGSSSADIRAQGEFTVTGATTDIGEEKAYLTKVEIK
ncbi:glycoside hydrolase family 3 N-terminal domain-containing protein [Gilvimarinus agarilyticus]|uniref:glycoside hydrolase family 3 N-terminal domain-containing protein n=1 Tax=Gilvimarinus agarilyticus TaxID=679259 RepID=UPI000A9BAAA0|nr:glycoside hydrolase family 3 N-terminal domain-containing protein [Gilvimarinus agarilyticus]